MRTNVDNLAENYALEQCPAYTKLVRNKTITDEYREIYDHCKNDFKEGFNKCLELVKPLLDKAIEDFKSEYGDNEDYKYTYEKIEEFLKKYK